MIKTPIYFLQAIIIYLFFLLGKLLGLSISRRFFSYLFKKIGPLIKSKKIILNNLKRYSVDITNDKQQQIISNMWSNYGMTFIEYIFLNDFREKNSHINIQGKSILEKISASEKPVIFVSGHFANFELMSMEITKKKN